jgi:hypothetical protein
MRKLCGLAAATVVSWGLMTGSALACGGLVAPNGAVRLQHTVTLAAYDQGVEHYVTSFEFAGGQTGFGSIIPLPGVPTDVRRAGSWTLQRLERETHPVTPAATPGLAASAALDAPAQVLLQTTVDALDITVLSGGGTAVLNWVTSHGFAVSSDAPAMLDFYARRSPVFLAARFDAAAARARGQLVGDGTPVQITIPTPNPWVPLHILSLAKGALEPVQADVYLLTDSAPALLGLSAGVRVQVSEPASTTLLSDLRSDRDSSWVPDRAWLTFVQIDSPAGTLVHDLAVDASGASMPSPNQAGYATGDAVPRPQTIGLRRVGAAVGLTGSLVPRRAGGWRRPLLAGVLVGLAVLVGLVGVVAGIVVVARRRPV